MLSRSIPLSCSAVTLQSKVDNCVLLSIIFEHATGLVYEATPDVLCIPNGRLSAVKKLSEAFLVSYCAKGDRIDFISENIKLFKKASLFLNYGGPLDIARIASGRVDAMIETYKGFKSYDLLSGMFILERAGGVIVDLNGKKISTSEIKNNQRTKFIAAGTKELADEILFEIKMAGLI